MVVFVGSILALAIGSALSVLADAPETWRGLFRSRSRCSHCGHALGIADLIPIVSFLALRGRCRYCRKPIPWWHLATEIGCLLLFLAAYAQGIRGADLPLVTAALIILFALAIVDLRFWILPDVLVGLLALVGILRSAVVLFPTLPEAVSGGVLGLVLLGGLAVVSRERAMGWGDVKLAGAMGLVLGWKGLLLALAVAFVAGGLIGGILILSRRASMKSHVPFGPFLAGATAFLLLWPELLMYAGDTWRMIVGLS